MDLQDSNLENLSNPATLQGEHALMSQRKTLRGFYLSSRFDIVSKWDKMCVVSDPYTAQVRDGPQACKAKNTLAGFPFKCVRENANLCAFPSTTGIRILGVSSPK